MGFGNRLRLLREAANLTQSELADRAGMSKAGIANLEQGRRKPEWDTLQKLAKALSVPLDSFTGDSEKEGTGVPEKRMRGRPARH